MLLRRSCASGGVAFQLTPANAPTVVRICQRLDGIPLALELAAARMKLLSLEQISARLDDRFQLLTGGSRTAVPRQQTLRATIDWSYDLLSDEERRLLRRLAVFAGGCSLEAAEQVCGGDDSSDGDTLELLSHLIDKSLVAVEDEDGERRYRLLETVRQYARDRLFESGEAAALRDRHLHFFERLALEAEPELLGPNHIAWASRLTADHDNLRAALEWGLATSGNAETPLRMVCALWSFWNQRNYFAEGRQWVERALPRLPNRRDHSVCEPCLPRRILHFSVATTRRPGHFAARCWRSTISDSARTAGPSHSRRSFSATRRLRRATPPRRNELFKPRWQSPGRPVSRTSPVWCSSARCTWPG